MANLNYDIMRLIFQYLNSKELHHASLVCRFWRNIAEDELRSRGPVCIIKHRHDTVTIKLWRARYKENLRFLRIKVCVQMHFTQNLLLPTLEEECFCREMPNNCFSLFMGNFYAHKNNNYICNLFLPEVSPIKITTRSFLAEPWNQVLFCPEIIAYMDPSMKNFYTWQSNFEDLFINSKSIPTCMFFFCDRSSLCIAKSLLKYYLKCFPDNETSVWGGILDVITICLFKCNKHLCRSRSSCASIFISGVSMKTWMVTLSNDCSTKEEIEKKLTDFKMGVNLRKHSIGLIYISYFRYHRFSDLDFTTFEQIFPKMSIVYMCGIAGFGGNVNDVITTISNVVPGSDGQTDNQKDTFIMILTYN